MSSRLAFADTFERLTAAQKNHDEPAYNRAVREAFDALLGGLWTPVQIAGLAVALRLAGPTPGAIVAAAEAMRAAMIPVDHALPIVADTCGTGGDGFHTWNISTGAALVVAALGIPVAKHGNRAVSGTCGSADVLEALGVDLQRSAHDQSALLQDLGICFLFAPVHHPAMRHAAPARRELGIRTIFNVLGPLVNPARATHQLVGVYDDELRPVLAEALHQLGSHRAWVVRGVDGFDELSVAGPTRVTVCDQEGKRELVVTPEDFALRPLDARVLRGGNAAENAAMLRTVFERGEHPAKAAVVLNAAATVCVVRGVAPREAREQVEHTLQSGRVAELLDRWKSSMVTAHAGDASPHENGANHGSS